MKTHYEEEADMEDEHEDLEEDTNAMNEYEDDGVEKAQNDLIAAGLEDSDAEDDLVKHLPFLCNLLQNDLIAAGLIMEGYCQKIYQSN